MRIAIVGAGLAGLSCARALRAGGADVRLFDKERGAGGRMATRRVETALGAAAFDHGAQYLTARDPGFRAQVEAWAAAGHVAAWPAAGEDARVGALAAHRWRYARSGTAGQEVLWDKDLRVSACGDWLIGPRVESAWLSGRRLAHAVLEAA